MSVNIERQARIAVGVFWNDFGHSSNSCLRSGKVRVNHFLMPKSTKTDSKVLIKNGEKDRRNMKTEFRCNDDIKNFLEKTKKPNTL